MPTYQVTGMADGVALLPKPVNEILEDLKLGGALKTLSPLEYHTDCQRRWYKGVCLRGLADWSGDTSDEWDLILKAACGGDDLLKKEKILLPSGEYCERLTIVGVGKRNLTQYIENILSHAITHNLPVTPPEKELRRSA